MAQTKEVSQMKRQKITPGTLARAEGSKWQTNFNDAPDKLNLAERLGSTGSDNDEIADSVSRLFKPLSTQAVILKVRADIAQRCLPLPESVFISSEHHSNVKSMMKLVERIRD
jgi:hypothetical protein